MRLKSDLETTAHTFAATLGFLGLHEEIQEEIHEQIISVIGHGRDPVSILPYSQYLIPWTR